MQSGSGGGDAGEQSLEGFDPKQAGGRLIQRIEVGNQYAIFFGMHCNSGVLGERGEARLYFHNLLGKPVSET